MFLPSKQRERLKIEIEVFKNAERKHHIKEVENFIINTYSNFSKIESLSMMLSIAMARRAFELYMRDQKTELPYFQLNRHCDRILNTASSNPVKLRKELGYLTESFICRFTLVGGFESFVMKLLSPALRTDCINTLDNLDATDPEFSSVTVNLVKRLQDETLRIMAALNFDSFLVSRHYSTWRVAESCHAIATTALDTRQAATLYMSDESSSSRGVPVPSIRAPMNQRSQGSSLSRDLCISAFINVHDYELDDLLTGENWLAPLMAAAEALPIGFSVACVKKAKNFPIVYVNKYFQKLTGYDRQTVVGMPSFFLHTEDSQASSLKKFLSCLAKGKSCAGILHNFTATGKRFANLIVQKPILDEKKRYRYVVTTYFDVSDEKDKTVKVKLMVDLMSMLPPIFFDD